MTAPRSITPGAIVHISRQCHDRQFMMRPDPDVVHHFEYLLAVGIARYELGLITAVGMSNHHHVQVHDPKGESPNFMKWFHPLLARSINRLRGRCGSMFSGDQAGLSELGDPESVERVAAYILCNPVEAGAVKHGRDWPGHRSSPHGCVQPARVIKRPVGFFDENGDMPEEAVLRFIAPPSHPDLTPGQWAERLSTLVREREAMLHEAAAEVGHKFGTARSVLKVPWKSSPKTPDQRFQRVPPYAAATKERRKEMKRRLIAFRLAYRAALQSVREGLRDILFPGGTFAMVHRLGFSAHPPPPPFTAC